MAAPIPTTEDVLLLSVLGQVQAVTGFPPERAGISQTGNPEQAPRQAEQFILVRAEGQTPSAHDVERRGRQTVRCKAKISVVLWTRLNLDESQRDLSRLTDVNLGHLKFQAKLWDALVAYEPTDGSGNWLVSEPIKPGAATQPFPGAKDNAQIAGWIWSGAEFVVDYILSLPTTAANLN